MTSRNSTGKTVEPWDLDHDDPEYHEHAARRERARAFICRHYHLSPFRSAGERRWARRAAVAYDALAEAHEAYATELRESRR